MAPAKKGTSTVVAVAARGRSGAASASAVATASKDVAKMVGGKVKKRAGDLFSEGVSMIGALRRGRGAIAQAAATISPAPKAPKKKNAKAGPVTPPAAESRQPQESQGTSKKRKRRLGEEEMEEILDVDSDVGLGAREVRDLLGGSDGEMEDSAGEDEEEEVSETEAEEDDEPAKKKLKKTPSLDICKRRLKARHPDFEKEDTHSKPVLGKTFLERVYIQYKLQEAGKGRLGALFYRKWGRRYAPANARIKKLVADDKTSPRCQQLKEALDDATNLTRPDFFKVKSWILKQLAKKNPPPKPSQRDCIGLLSLFLMLKRRNDPRHDDVCFRILRLFATVADLKTEHAKFLDALHDKIDEYLCFRLEAYQREPQDSKVNSSKNANANLCTPIVPEDTLQKVLEAQAKKDFTDAEVELNVCVASGEVFRRLFYDDMVIIVEKTVDRIFQDAAKVVREKKETITLEWFEEHLEQTMQTVDQVDNIEEMTQKRKAKIAYRLRVYPVPVDDLVDEGEQYLRVAATEVAVLLGEHPGFLHENYVFPGAKEPAAHGGPRHVEAAILHHNKTARDQGNLDLEETDGVKDSETMKRFIKDNTKAWLKKDRTFNLEIAMTEDTAGEGAEQAVHTAIEKLMPDATKSSFPEAAETFRKLQLLKVHQVMKSASKKLVGEHETVTRALKNLVAGEPVVRETLLANPWMRQKIVPALNLYCRHVDDDQYLFTGLEAITKQWAHVQRRLETAGTPLPDKDDLQMFKMFPHLVSEEIADEVSKLNKRIIDAKGATQAMVSSKRKKEAALEKHAATNKKSNAKVQKKKEKAVDTESMFG